MAKPTTTTLFRAIQAKNVPAATVAFNSLIQEKLKVAIANEYRATSADFFGSAKKLTESAECLACNGSGYDDDDQSECPECRGSGNDPRKVGGRTDTNREPSFTKVGQRTDKITEASLPQKFTSAKGFGARQLDIDKMSSSDKLAYAAYQKGKAGPGITWGMLSPKEKAALAAGKKLTEGKIDRKPGEDDSDYFERLTDIFMNDESVSDSDMNKIKKIMDDLDDKHTRAFFGVK
jgi:hypothetical protein